MARELRREQIDLLRFEKLLKESAEAKASGKTVSRAALVAGVAALAAPAQAAAEKLGAEEANAYQAAMQQAVDASNEVTGELLVTLAEIAGKGHAFLQELAMEANFRLWEVGGGTPKGEPPVIVKSILGL